MDSITKARKALRLFVIAAIVGSLVLLVVAERTMATLDEGLVVADSAAVAANAAAQPAGDMAENLEALAKNLAEGTRSASELAAVA